MKKLLVLLLLTLPFFSLIVRPPLSLESSALVAEVLEQLGDPPLSHRPNLEIKGVSVDRGRDLVLKGVADKPNRGTTSKQSKHFVCTSCHNVQRDEPTLTYADPQARLLYVKEQGLPYLPGTSLYGAVNRTSFYNGDYEKKYGDLVKPARNNLREAIQLCAIECSQGRRLKDWEVESVLAYLWTIGLKMEDLGLTRDQWQVVEQALNGPGDAAQAIALIKARYAPAAPATFVKPPDNRQEGNGLAGDPEKGRLIYDLSCLHCHEGGRYAFFDLDKSQYSYRLLAKNFPRYTNLSVYQVARWGTQPKPGKRAYMPNYTLEKMSRQQIEDLRAFLTQAAEGTFKEEESLGSDR